MAHRVENYVRSLASRQGAAGAPQASGAGRAAVGAAAPDPELFNPAALARLGSLELIAQTVVDGYLSGKHRSTHKGGCTEFASFRPYTPGDDIRMLDWRHYAKSDRYYVKQFEDETNLQALLVVDASGSMGFGRSTVSKWRYATMAAACLARLVVRQRDAAGLAIADAGLREYVRPLPRAGALARLLGALQHAAPAGRSDLGGVLTTVSGRLTRRGLVLVLSDCFGDPDSLTHGLSLLRVRGHDVLVLQVLAPEEQTFPFARSTQFLDLESSRRLHVHPAEVRRGYLEKFGAHQRALADGFRQAGVDHTVLTTNRDLGDALAHYLHRRAARRATPRA